MWNNTSPWRPRSLLLPPLSSYFKTLHLFHQWLFLTPPPPVSAGDSPLVFHNFWVKRELWTRRGWFTRKAWGRLAVTPSGLCWERPSSHVWIFGLLNLMSSIFLPHVTDHPRCLSPARAGLLLPWNEARFFKWVGVISAWCSKSCGSAWFALLWPERTHDGTYLVMCVSGGSGQGWGLGGKEERITVFYCEWL